MTVLVYIKIPAALEPIERGELFEDPIQELLESHDIGTTGGGSLLSAPNGQGRRKIEYCGIDVDLYDPARGLPLPRSELVRLNAPPGTVLLYEREGQQLEEPIYPHRIC